MPVDFVSHLETLNCTIKQRWTALLCADRLRPIPANSIVRPEMLVFMFDDTLERLRSRLRLPPAAGRPHRDFARDAGQRASCECGLQLLEKFYLAGAQALHESLPSDLGPARVEVLHAFNRLAHDDMAALCGLCRYRGGSLCSLRPAPPALSPPRAAASPATPSATGRSLAGTPG